MNKYVIIGLKRKIYNAKAKSFTKISKPVSFPLDNLNLQPYTDQSFISSPYRLKAFIIHNGNANGGHYSAYVRLAEQWYLCDDTYILAIPTPAIAQMANHGYASSAAHTPVIFFYEMQNKIKFNNYSDFGTNITLNSLAIAIKSSLISSATSAFCKIIS